MSSCQNVALVTHLRRLLPFGLLVPLGWYWAATGSRIAGCGSDGAWYCRMAEGKLAVEPYASRPLAPWLAGHLPLPLALLDRFLVVDLVALVAGAAALALLARRFGANRDVQMLVAALYVSSPFGLRWALYYPANADLVPAALLLWWLLCWIAGWRWGALLLIPIAVAARGETALIVALSAVAGWRGARSYSAIAIGLAAAAFAAISVLPSQSSDFSLLTWMPTAAAFRLHQPLDVATTLVLPAGAIPLLLTRFRPRRWSPAVLAAVAVAGLSAVVGYGDGPRLLTPAAMLVVASAVPIAAGRNLRWTIAGIAATLALWEPWWPLSRAGGILFVLPGYSPTPYLALRLAADVGLLVIGGDLALFGWALALKLGWQPRKEVTPTDRLFGSGTGLTTSSGSVERVPRGRAEL